MPFLNETVGDSILVDGVTVDNTVNNASFDLEGDIAVRNGGKFLTGTGGVNFVGAKDGHILTSLSGDNSLGDMSINKTVGNLYIDGDSVTVKTSIDFQSGNVITNGNVFYMLQNATYSNASSSSYVQGFSCKEMFNGATFEFPVGDNSFFAPAFVNSSSEGDWCAAFYDVNPSDDGFNVLLIKSETNQIEDVSDRGYWTITGAANTLVTRPTAFAGVGLTWPYGSNPFDTPGGEVVAEWDSTLINTAPTGPPGKWYNKGGFYSPNVLTSNDSVKFSTRHFTFATTKGVLLPVDLLYVKAKTVADGALIEWATAMEVNNDRFIIERSIDLVNFEAIGTVQGQGNSNIEAEYDYLDTEVPTGTVYFRLKQIDFDGEYEYSKIVAVLIESRIETVDEVIDLAIYPNPSRTGEVITFEFVNLIDRNITVGLFDIKGRLIYQSSYELGEGELFVLEEDLPAGIYIARTIVGNHTIVKRIVIQ
jgi:hypothetical protein